MLASKPWAVLWLLAIRTGCCESELLALGWSDVYLGRGTLT